MSITRFQLLLIDQRPKSNNYSSEDRQKTYAIFILYFCPLRFHGLCLLNIMFVNLLNMAAFNFTALQNGVIIIAILSVEVTLPD